MAQFRCLIDPRAAKLETWEPWTAAMQVAEAMFAAGTSDSPPTRRRILHDVHEIPAVGGRSFTDAGNWLTAFWLAMICRESDRLAKLCEVPVDLLRQSGAVYDEYIYSWVKALQGFWVSRPTFSEDLVEAFNGTAPEVLQVADREHILKVLFPPMDLFLQLVKRDADQFNQCLERGLKLHREYWNASEERTEATEGTVPIALLAITCLAFDTGITVELPHHLLNRTWVGEFPT